MDRHMFSRVKSLDGLFITHFYPTGIRANKKVEGVMTDLRAKYLPESAHTNQISENIDMLTVGHLNVHYFLAKLNDLLSTSESFVYSQTDIMCFTETYLTKDHNIDLFLQKYNYQPFHQFVPNERSHQGKHGTLVFVASHLNPQPLDLIHVQGLESKVVAVTTLVSNRLIVAVVYRSPSQTIIGFAQQLETLLLMMNLNIPTIILGDFNDNLNSSNESTITKLMQRYGLQQQVRNSTTDAGSLLDHIYFNRDCACSVKIHDAYYSNHDATFFTTNI